MTRAVVFDLDGTLIDSLPDIAHAANETLAEFDLAPLPQAQIGGFVGMGEQVFLDLLIEATALDPAQRETIEGRFIRHYMGATDRTKVMPGALDALARLKADGWRIGLCTNKPGGPLRSVLEALDLARWFDVTVAGDTLDVRKPDPAPLRHAFEALKATSGLYVGDSETDAETAQRAKVPFAIYAHGIRKSPLDEIPHTALFQDFADLPPICEEVLVPLRSGSQN